jgi:hypothetical protein
MGRAATGNSIDVYGMNFFDIEDGLIRHIQAYFNPLHLLEPVGLVTTQSALELPKKPE